MGPDPSFRPRTEPLEPREVPTAAGLYAIGGGAGGPPRVQVFDASTGAVVGDFLAYEPTFAGGVNPALGDVNNDGFPDLIVGAGVGGGPRVRVFDGRTFRAATVNLPGVVPAPVNGKALFPEGFVLADFFAYEESQRGGTFVSAGNFSGAAFADVVIGAGPGGGPRVRILDGEQMTKQGRAFAGVQPLDTVANFFAFEASFRNGVAVSATPPLFGAGFSDLVVAPGLGGGPRVRLLDGSFIAAQRLGYTSLGPNEAIADFFAADPETRSGLFVTTADYNSDGIPDVAVGTGPGLSGAVTIYSGAAMRSRRPNFFGTAPGDILDRIVVNPPADAAAGPSVYSNGVTVGSAIVPGGINVGALIVGWGGEGRFGRAQVIRFQTGSGFLTRTVLFDHLFDPNFVGGVFVSN
jgi:hypothetical protein